MYSRARCVRASGGSAIQRCSAPCRAGQFDRSSVYATPRHAVRLSVCSNLRPTDLPVSCSCCNRPHTRCGLRAARRRLALSYHRIIFVAGADQPFDRPDSVGHRKSVGKRHTSVCTPTSFCCAGLATQQIRQSYIYARSAYTQRTAEVSFTRAVCMQRYSFSCIIHLCLKKCPTWYIVHIFAKY